MANLVAMLRLPGNLKSTQWQILAGPILILLILSMMVLPLPAFAFPLGFPSCIDPAGSGTICLAGCRKICLSTHRAYFLSHGGVLAGNG